MDTSHLIGPPMVEAPETVDGSLPSIQASLAGPTGEAMNFTRGPRQILRSAISRTGPSPVR